MGTKLDSELKQLINFENGKENLINTADLFEQQEMKYDSTGMFHWFFFENFLNFLNFC